MIIILFVLALEMNLVDIPESETDSIKAKKGILEILF